MNDVLVGVDPGELPVAALVWAADEAVRRGWTLRLVCAVPPVHDRFAFDAVQHQSALRIRAESALADAEDLVRELHTGLSPVTELTVGPPATALRERAVDTSLTVVGSRRLGHAAEILSARSVALPLMANAACPVAVVRAPGELTVHPPFLCVGVDGSEACRAAVAFAIEEASLRDVQVRAVWVWPRPLVGQDDEAIGRAGQRWLAEAVAGWAERFPDMDIQQEILRGHPVEQLAAVSDRAVALIVGRRGRGGFTGLRLGSTAHGLLHRATCPLITVP